MNTVDIALESMNNLIDNVITNNEDENDVALEATLFKVNKESKLIFNKLKSDASELVKFNFEIKSLVKNDKADEAIKLCKQHKDDLYKYSQKINQLAEATGSTFADVFLSMIAYCTLVLSIPALIHLLKYDKNMQKLDLFSKCIKVREKACDDLINELRSNGCSEKAKDLADEFERIKHDDKTLYNNYIK